MNVLPQQAKALGMRLQFRSAVGIIIPLWLAYTVLNTLYPSDAIAAVLGFIPGVLGIGSLFAAGLTSKECYLRVAPISRVGLALLAVLSFIEPLILLSGHWTGWNWISALVYAPASGISQDLFFRAALLPVLMGTFKKRSLLAVSLHSVLFALWHVRVFMEAPLGGAIGVMIVTFLGGMVWGWQVQRDGTVVYAMAHHTLLLIVQSMFAWG